MRFNKHQRDIIKAINNKEVYDIESFVKKFKLYQIGICYCRSFRQNNMC